MNKIRQLLWNVISSGLPSSSDIEVLRKMVLLNLMFLFGGTCLFLFIIVAHAKENILLAAVDSTVLAFLIALFVYLRKTGNYRRTGALGTTATGLFFTFIIAYGVINQTALIWSLTYPLIALFLLGLKRGVQMSLLLLAMAIAIFILGKEVSWLPVYQTDVIVRFIPAYLLIFFFSFTMEKVRDMVHGRLEASNLELQNVLDDVREGTAALAESNRELRVEITERKRVEEALRQSEEKYRTILKNIEEGYYEVDITGNFTFLNDSMYRIFGYPKEELIGMNDRQYTDQETAKRLFQAYNKVYRTGIPDKGYDYEIRRKDGAKRYVEASVSLQKDSSGKTIGFKGIIRDITEHKRAEEEMRSLETKLQRAQKMEAIGLMAGGVAHDLNNMLTAFVSLPELILMDIPEENQKLRREIQMIMSSGQRTAAIVDDLLTVTRGVTMARDTLNLNKIVQEYMRSPEFKKLRQFHPKVEVVTELADDLLPIRGSRVHLMKTLMNLVSNASEAIRTSDSGVVSVSTQNRYVDEPLEGYERVNIGEYAVLVVKDNGMGISPQDMERIFEPFYTKKVMGRSGTGLGLSVVWNTVTDHGGYIHVESGDGGTVFELYFQITRESVSEQEKPLDLEQYKGRGEKVLVVDDVLDQRVIAVDILSKLGYQAEAVSGGQEALEFLKEHEVDILLLDMLMPGMDGCDTFSQIVQLKPGQKAVIASGFSMSDRVKKAQELGAGAYIRKPYSVEKLGMAIKTELDK